jgi:hypothetical protein
MLTNGFFARMIVVECGHRGAGQEPRLLSLPPRVLETATWWADLQTSGGNLAGGHPLPRTIPHSECATEVLIQARLQADAEYTKAVESSDPMGAAVWGRVNEHARKLALIHAVSESHQRPVIGQDAAEWASRFVMHQARRMLFMAESHVAETPFQAQCLKFREKLKNAPGQELPHSLLLKRLKIDAKSFSALVTTLEQRGDIVVRTESTSGRPGRYYKLVAGAGRNSGEETGEEEMKLV